MFLEIIVFLWLLFLQIFPLKIKPKISCCLPHTLTYSRTFPNSATKNEKDDDCMAWIQLRPHMTGIGKDVSIALPDSPPHSCTTTLGTSSHQDSPPHSHTTALGTSSHQHERFFISVLPRFPEVYKVFRTHMALPHLEHMLYFIWISKYPRIFLLLTL